MKLFTDKTMPGEIAFGIGIVPRDDLYCGSGKEIVFVFYRWALVLQTGAA